MAPLKRRELVSVGQSASGTLTSNFRVRVSLIRMGDFCKWGWTVLTSPY